MESIAVTLPTGFAAGKQWYRNARLRPLNGADEEVVSESAGPFLPAERVTALLKSCLMHLGPKTSIVDEDVRSLSVGDRDALLLHLHRLTFGDRIHAILSCPQPSCKEKMDLELTIGDILVPPKEQAQESYEMVISKNSTAYKVKFRLPTGADQEEVAELALRDQGAASKLMLRRCIQAVEREGTKIRINDKLPAAVAEMLPKMMAELDPQAEVLLDMTCPTCRQHFVVNFDIGDYFFRELMNHPRQLYREVHVLALHYHWSEREIMNMPRLKRQIYLGLLAETLSSEES